MFLDDPVRNLLEDFDAVATRLHAVLISKNAPAQLRTNLQASLVATTLALSSVDYARRRYVNEIIDGNENLAKTSYAEAYRCAKSYIGRLRARITTEGRPEPEVGVFASSIVLERLSASFFCAHLLYSLGHRYEGHSISRLILEQVAWAYQAHCQQNVDAIQRIETTRSISKLKTILPQVGRLYGFLSAKTHIDYDSHREFLQAGDGVNIIQHAQREFIEYTDVLLQLADFFGVVWEVSQRDYLTELEAIEAVGDGPPVVKGGRPFLTEMRKHLNSVEEATKPRRNGDQERR
jgi:hypothetical protein